MFWSDTGILVGSRSFDRIQFFWSDPGLLIVSRSDGRIQFFWPDPGFRTDPSALMDQGVLVGSRFSFYGSGGFGRIRVLQKVESGSIFSVGTTHAYNPSKSLSTYHPLYQYKHMYRPKRLKTRSDPVSNKVRILIIIEDRSFLSLTFY